MTRNRLFLIFAAILMTAGLSSCFFRDHDEHRGGYRRGHREHREGREGHRGEHRGESKHEGGGDRK